MYGPSHQEADFFVFRSSRIFQVAATLCVGNYGEKKIERQVFHRQRFDQQTQFFHGIKGIGLWAAALGLAECSSSAKAAPTEQRAQSQSAPNFSQVTTRAFVDIVSSRLMGYCADGVYTFLGIPHATANRFQDPQPVTSYGQGFYAAMSFSAMCPTAPHVQFYRRAGPQRLQHPFPQRSGR
ncbi:MAG: hypothetical protein DUD39_08190 [Coriobacteriaceae bacterium]|nr:MAG: hypothetical protein DUD39_08190 [Coriobacteriaceae bacterium]